MAIEIKMPALSPTMEEGTLAKWLVKEGDTVKSGDIMAEIETDKATMEFEAVDEGTIGKILVAEGTDNVKVGTVIATLDGEGEERRGASAGASRRAGRRSRRPPSREAPEPQAGRDRRAADVRGGQARRRGRRSRRFPPAPRWSRSPCARRCATRWPRKCARDDRVFVMGEEVAQYQGAYKVTQGLLDEFGDKRVIDTPITEYGFAGVGTGAAMGGLRPIVEFMTFNFAMQAIDHIINSAAKTNYMSGGQMRCPIVFRGPNGAASRVGAQHSQNYGPWYASVPGLIVIAPYDAADAKGLLKAAIRTEDPVVFLENELLYGRTFDVPEARRLRPADRQGADHARGQGRDDRQLFDRRRASAWKPPTSWPRRGSTPRSSTCARCARSTRQTVLKSLAKTNRIVVAEEGWPTCSIAAEVAAFVMEEGFDDLDAPVLRVTNEDVPLPYAANLEKLALISADKVVRRSRRCATADPNFGFGIKGGRRCPTWRVRVGVGAALALAIVGACWVLYTGLRAKAAASATASRQRQAVRVARAPRRHWRWWCAPTGGSNCPTGWPTGSGWSPPPRFLADMVTPGAGLTSEDAAMLGDAVTAAQKAGEPFALAIRPQGSARTLTVRGQRAPREVGAPGGVVVWFFDATESQAQIGAIARRDRATHRRVRRAEGADRGRAAADVVSRPRSAAGDGQFGLCPRGRGAGRARRRGARGRVDRGIGARRAAGQRRQGARQRSAQRSQTLPATINGARRMLRVHDVPLPTPPGGVAGFAIDIEELEQARGGIKRFADAQRAMLDRLSAGVAQFAADKSLELLQPAVPADVRDARRMARRPARIRPRARTHARGESLARSARFPRLEGRAARLVPGGDRRDRGKLDAARRHASARGRRIRLPDGGLLLIFEDRTEQVQLASARDTLLRVRTATFDNLFEALGVFAGDGRLQIWNDKFRQLWGFDEEFLATHPRDRCAGRAGSATLAQPSRAGVIAELVRSAAVGRTQRAGRVAFADGRHFEFAGVPLPDGNALFTMLDISDSRRAEQALRDRNEALEAADRVKTAFVANMSYELRTPLTSIQGFAEMMGEGYAGKLSKQADGYVDAILESVARLSALVDDVLDLSRGRARRSSARTSISKAIAYAAAEAVAPAAKRKAIDFAIEVAPSTGTVKGDAKKLREMIEHLLRHAVAGVGEGGRVLLHTDGDATRARIVVSDDGAGMDQAAVDRAFDRFADRPSRTTAARSASACRSPSNSPRRMAGRSS